MKMAFSSEVIAMRKLCMTVILGLWLAGCGASTSNANSLGAPRQTPPTSTATVVTAVPSVPSATGTAAAASAVTVQAILAEPERYRDQPVEIEGFGLIQATVPLCSGYVGLDQRTRFMDADRQLIVATLKGPGLEQAIAHDQLRRFRGYVRLFEGTIGCPGQTSEATIPYFEITAIE